LQRKAKEFAEKREWLAFNSLVAVLIYGLVLFPSVPNFVDSDAVHIFMGKNPVPTLLADTYYIIHSKYGTKKSINCCLPLLYKWFLSHLPLDGPFWDTKDACKWGQRIMGLTSHDIRWHNLKMDTARVITSCGEYPNVPLIGRKGCINYNPVLALRQLGYALNDQPLDREVDQSVYFEKKMNPELYTRVCLAWNKIHVKDSTLLGRKNAIARNPYVTWVKKRVETLLLPFR